MEDKLAKVDKLKVVAKELGATLPQLAIAWCAKNPNVSTVIMGATKEAQVLFMSPLYRHLGFYHFRGLVVGVEFTTIAMHYYQWVVEEGWGSRKFC